MPDFASQPKRIRILVVDDPMPHRVTPRKGEATCISEYCRLLAQFS
jgi:hypothetical protein